MVVDLFGNTYHPYTRKSPLKYPGGKWYARSIVRYYFPRILTEIVSPFCGGAHIELSCAADGIQVYAYDKFKDLINFWQQLQSHPESVWDKGGNYLVGIDTNEMFKAMLKLYDTLDCDLEKAALFYALRKSSYAGMGTGLMSQKRIRQGLRFPFRKGRPSVDILKTFYAPLIEFACADFEDALNNHPDIFAYLDPPYLIESALYGKNGEMHKGFEHDRLCEVLRKRNTPWVLSYNNCDTIKQMYAGYRFEFPVWHQSLAKVSQGNEILIISE